MGAHATPGTTACAEPRGSINQLGRGCWPASRMAGARPCCRSNKIPRPCFFGGEEDGGSPSSPRRCQNLPPARPSVAGSFVNKDSSLLSPSAGGDGDGGERRGFLPGPGGEGWVVLEFRLLRYH